MRLFLGTLLSAENQRFYADFSEAILRRHGGVLHAVPDGTAHLTYVFSGDAPGDCLDMLAGVVRQAVAGTAAFAVELGPPRVLMAGNRPRLVCADLRKGAAAFATLALDLLHGIQRANLPLTPVGSKAPHVTLLRFSKRARPSDARNVAETLGRGPWVKEVRTDRVSQVQIIVSTLTPSGPVYDARVTCELR